MKKKVALMTRHHATLICEEARNMLTEAGFEIVSNEKLTESVYKMVLRGDTSAITKPGQFVNIAVSGL